MNQEVNICTMRKKSGRTVIKKEKTLHTRKLKKQRSRNIAIRWNTNKDVM